MRVIDMRTGRIGVVVCEGTHRDLVQFADGEAVWCWPDELEPRADLRIIDRRNQPPLVLFSDQSGEDLLSSPNGKDDGPGY